MISENLIAYVVPHISFNVKEGWFLAKYNLALHVNFAKRQ